MKKTILSLCSPTAIIFSLSLVAACSDSGGGGAPIRNNPPAPVTPTPTPPPPPPSGPTWTAGVYEPASNFKDRCEVVRTGVDIEGNPYPDRPGSTVEENFWLRSWTHETYLWNDEVTDRNPANFVDPVQFFDLLKTNEFTASGREKDQFHFSQSTEEFLEERNAAPTASYGASYIAFSVTPPRDFRIQYTESGSPAAQQVGGLANFTRGARILEVDGVDLVNANTDAEIDTLNDGLFPETAGEMHTFVVQDAGSSMSRTVMLTSEDLAVQPVNRTNIINTSTGDVGYVLITTFSPFSSEKAIADAISDMKAQGISDLVLDLRYNGGGLLAVASQLSYMVAGDAQTNGKIFEQLRFNADAGNTNPVTGDPNDPFPFIKTGLGFSVADGTPLESLDLPRVFVLSTDETCSASESIINSLRGIDVDVVFVGSATCGKPFGFYPTDNCGMTYFTIQFQGVNNKNFGDYPDGFIANNSNASYGLQVPGCAVADDYSHELGDESEALLAAALQYRQNGSCPTPPTSQGLATQSVGVTDPNAPGAIAPQRSIARTNRDMRVPD